MGTVRVEHCPDCGQMVGEGTLYEHQQRVHRLVISPMHGLVKQWKADYERMKAERDQAIQSRDEATALIARYGFDKAKQEIASLRARLSEVEAERERYKHAMELACDESREAQGELATCRREREDETRVREKLADLLRRTALALKGPPPELTSWGWHDLPDIAASLRAEQTRLREALKKARTFIEYARYVLEPGAPPMRQFPSQDDADKEMARIDAALSSTPTPETTP